ncbi:sigma-70 family RNA polymerase sigma factor [uncultured Aquimarina sp.]|uniref:RNA polymerase sigma factor n=1 Tax=uncultured Aquimarina sp. TaxID=575652 RepID=UPI00260D6744|nr:sigma-70 family RNA polymerase sigma factor [uncultured Aquimarina sp.]
MGYNDEIKIFNGILYGNNEILKDFYKRNFIIIKSFIIKNSGTEKDAEDIFQDALVILYQKIKNDSLVLDYSIHTYFYGISKNIWMRRLSKLKKVSCCGRINDLVSDTNFSIIDNIEQRDRESLYRKYLLNLNCKCKDLLFLFFDGKSMKEIAQLTNYTEGYVRKRKFECKKHLMELIAKDPLYSELGSDKKSDIKKDVS